MQLEGNTILLTGATRGIGKALLTTFYKLGNNVIAVARNKNALAELKTEFPKISTFACDLGNPEEIKLLVNHIKTHHPATNTLINNAGIQVNFYDHKFGAQGDRMEELKTEIQVNLTAPIELTYSLIPLLQQNPNASVVNVSSGLAFAPKKSAPVYCATKAAIHIFSKSLRYQYESENLKVFEIIPSIVATDMTKGRGKSKITPQELVDEFMRGYEKNRYEISIGKTKWLRRIQRILPKVADNILKDN